MSAVALNIVLKSRSNLGGDGPRNLRRFKATFSAGGLDLERLSGPGGSCEDMGSGENKPGEYSDVAYRRSSGSISNIKLQRLAKQCARLIETNTYKFVVVLAIIFYAIWVGLNADYTSYPEQSSDVMTSNTFYLVSAILSGFFTLEIIVRMFALYPNVWNFFYNDERIQWINNLDFLVTILVAVDDWVLQFAIPSRDGESQYFYILARVCRLLRMVRLFALIPQLSFIAKALGTAIRSVAATFVILVTAIYIFAVVFTQWSEESGHEATDPYFVDHFSSVFLAMLSMFELAIYDDTITQIKTVMDVSILMGILDILFVIIGGFLILNVLIGVIAEVVSEQSDIEAAKRLVDQMDEIFTFIDSDGNNKMSKTEFLKIGRPLLLKIGISDYVIEGVASIIDVTSTSNAGLGVISNSSTVFSNDGYANYITREEFIHFMTKMLSEPSAEDLLLINKKISMLKSRYTKLFPISI